MFFLNATGYRGTVYMRFEGGLWDEPHGEKITPELAEEIGKMFLQAASDAREEQDD